MGLTAAILEPAGVDVERIAEVLPSGAAGAVIVARGWSSRSNGSWRTWRRCSRCSSRRCSR